VSVRLSILGSGSASAAAVQRLSVLDERVMWTSAHRPTSSSPASVRIQDIELVLLTHFHLDHVGMLPLLLGALAHADDPPEPGRLASRPSDPRAGPPDDRRRLRGSTQRRIEEVVAPRYVLLQDGSDVLIGTAACAATRRAQHLPLARVFGDRVAARRLHGDTTSAPAPPSRR